MRRVKKKFMKYWAGAGLYTGNDGKQAENAQGKGGPKNKAKKRQGMRCHKSDCLCAICVLKRKRKEREERERIERGQTAEEMRQESDVESPYGEEGEASSNSDDTQDEDAEADLEEKGVKLEISPDNKRKEKEEDAEGGEKGDIEMESQKHHQGQTPDKLQYRLEVEPEEQQVKEMESSGGFQENAVDQQNLKETPEKQLRSPLYESVHRENLALVSLCGILFPENPSSVWSGPHSLAPRLRLSTQPKSSIDAAIESFMK